MLRISSTHESDYSLCGKLTPRLGRLPRAFTYSEARAARISDRQLYELRDDHTLEMIGPGLFRKNYDGQRRVDLELLEVAKRTRAPTICLDSALALHGLADGPDKWHIALKRGAHRPALEAPVTWHAFDASTFAVGRTEHVIEEGAHIGLYGAERSLLDAIRVGHAVAVSAIKKWLEMPDADSAALTAMAEANFPRVLKRLKGLLEVLRA